MNWYYTLWTDALRRGKKHNKGNKDWRFKGFMLVSMMNALNYFFFNIWLKYFDIFEITPYEINLTNTSVIDGTLWFALNFLSPFLLLNYLLIFMNGKYKELEQGEPGKVNITFIYGMVSIGLGFGSAIAYGLLTNPPW